MDNAKGKMSKSSVPLSGRAGGRAGQGTTRIRGRIDCEWARTGQNGPRPKRWVWLRAGFQELLQ